MPFTVQSVNLQQIKVGLRFWFHNHVTSRLYPGNFVCLTRERGLSGSDQLELNFSEWLQKIGAVSRVSDRVRLSANECSTHHHWQIYEANVIYSTISTKSTNCSKTELISSSFWSLEPFLWLSLWQVAFIEMFDLAWKWQFHIFEKPSHSGTFLRYWQQIDILFNQITQTFDP